jgi:hypothetical protein
MSAPPPNPTLVPYTAVRQVTYLGVSIEDNQGAERFISFAECQANLALTLPRLSSSNTPLVGFRDKSAPTPWIELASRPAMRIVFEPGTVHKPLASSKFVVRQHPAGFLEFLASVAEHGYAFGDLA